MESYSAAVRQTGGGRCAGDDEEIGVFTAERYFSGADVDALWCGRSSSSFSFVFKTGGQQDWSAAPTTLTAATSSSEASWNSRSVLLPDRPVAVTIESEEPSGAAGDRTPGTKPSTPSLSHNLLRWLLGVAACACAGGGVEETVSAKEKRSTEEAGAALPGTKSKHTAVEEVTPRRVRPGMWDDGDAFDTANATPRPLKLAEPRRIRAANSGELSAPVLNPRTAVLADERRRRPMDMFASARQQNSAFTIVAGSAAARDDAAAAGTAGGGAGSPNPSPNRACGSRRDSGADDAATNELDCMYPPSEASVVWSVVTADGAASGNFSSAASGYYHHYYYNNGDGHERRTAAGKSNRRSGGGARTNGGGLLMSCMSERAVDAIGPARPLHRPLPSAPETGPARLEAAPTWLAAGRQ